MPDRWATFDCYGTLIDWDGGLGDTLSRLWPGEDRDRLLARYHEIEPAAQEGRALPYRDVLAVTLRRLADGEGLELGPGDEGAFADSLPSWPPFPEVPDALRSLRGRGWRIGILSNTDPDLLAASLASIGVHVDVTVTAAEAGSYKPALGHWRRFREMADLTSSPHVHVGASAFHDIAPANELGITTVWINRLGETSDLPRAAELPNLAELPDTLDRLVPARVQ